VSYIEAAELLALEYLKARTNGGMGGTRPSEAGV
jgi:hypothetical protein